MGKFQEISYSFDFIYRHDKMFTELHERNHQNRKLANEWFQPKNHLRHIRRPEDLLQNSILLTRTGALEFIIPNPKMIFYLETIV